MGTFSDLQTALATDLSDPSNLTFGTTDLAAFINEGVIEVGRIAPDRFQQDITPVDNQLEYTVRNGDPETELLKVEVWDTSTTPDSFVSLLTPASVGFSKSTGAGWSCWNGKLYIPPGVESIIDPSVHLYRVWGYAPYQIVSGSTEMPMSTELEWAVRAYAKVAAIQALVAKRNLFTQWQAQPDNTDITPAMLLQQLTMARSDWERRAAKITVLREAH